MPTQGNSRTKARAWLPVRATWMRRALRYLVSNAMRYGQPSIESRIKAMKDAGCDRILLAPLYPQYSGATTGTANDKAFEVLQAMRWQPAIRTLPPYHDDPAHIDALKRNVEHAIASLDFEPEEIVTSFHGMPLRTLQFAALGFDVAFQEVFATLSTGGTLIAIDQDTRMSAGKLFDFIVEQRVERMFLPYFALQMLAEGLVGHLAALPPGQRPDCVLREIITAGEQLRIEPKIVRFFQHLLIIQIVPAGHLPRILRPALDNRQVQFPVLTDQHVPGFGTLLVHAADVGHHVALEQVEQPPDGVQQHRVMAGLGDRQVEARISRALFRTGHFIDPGIAVLQRIEGRLQPCPVRLGGTLGSVIGAGRLQRMAKLEQVPLRLRAVFKQLQQRVTEGCPQRRRHIIAATLTTDQQPFGGELLNRFTQ